MSDSEKDLATLEAIGRIYCKAHHKNAAKDHAGLCPWCREVVSSTFDRSQQCPNGHTVNCQDCTIKCQRGEARDDVKEIMSYSAPRMVFKHPIMTIGYLRKKIR